ncbi:hypothetical protein P5F75_07880 [Caldifermentibacillus hisashii]|uniref:hypothetical protein n=1 Tax=Caldifermentibacillus hisashii TaxID=996558 RepID=UPI002E1AD262|nr:hypothetical protein [Caldifermentibacillus hisashii]
MVTRLALVAKFGCFSTKNGDENGSRRQIWAFSTKNGDEIGSRRQIWVFFN